MKRSQNHKHQLKDDAFSQERRSWYQTMQEPFMENYENFVRLQKIAQQESELHAAEAKTDIVVDRTRSKKDDYYQWIKERSKTFVPLNGKQIDEIEGDFVALLLHGIGTSHSAFMKLVETYLTPNNILAFGVCLPGRMHRVNDSTQPTIRLMIYQLYEELQALQFFQHYHSQNKKVILIGYSYGCLIAYELIRLLLNDGVENIAGFAAISCRSPMKQTRYNIDRDGQVFYHTEFNDIHLIQQIKEMNALPSLFLSCNELLKKFVSFFRYEFQLLETYLIEPPVIPGQNRSFITAEQEYRTSYFHHYFTSVIAPLPPPSSSANVSRIAESKEGGRQQSQAKLVSMNSAASISTVSTVTTLPFTARTHQTHHTYQTHQTHQTRQTQLTHQKSIPNDNNSAIHSTSANATYQSGTSFVHSQSQRKKIDEKLIKFQEEMNELIEMPSSLFKIQIPIFSISTMNDKIFTNDEDMKSWSNHSSIFHQHYIIEDEELGHFHLDNKETINVIWEIVQRFQTETFSSEI